MSTAVRRQTYFGLGILLVVVACLAALDAGYRRGFDRGYAAGQPKWPQQEIVSVAYDIGDLLELDRDGQPDFDSWIEALENAVQAPSWQQSGGLGTINANEASRSIVVDQALEVHEMIRGVLESIRDGRRKSKAAEPE